MASSRPFALLTALMLAAALAAPDHARAGADAVGTTSANFLKILPDARPAAMGEAYSALSNDEAALIYNPSGVARAIRDEVSATHIEWFQFMHLEHLGGVFPLGTLGVAGAGLTWLQVDGLALTTRDNPAAADPAQRFQQIGTFNPHDMALDLAFARPFSEKINLGAELEVVQQNIDQSNGYGASLNLGAQYLNLLPNLDLGADVHNLGTPVAVGGTPFSMPVTFDLGAAYRLFNRQLSLAAQTLVPLDNQVENSFGAEYWFHDLLALRAGYKSGYLDQYTVGMGVRMGDMRLDYAFVPYGDLGDSHRLTASYDFGEPSVGLSAGPRLFAPLGDPAWHQTVFSPRLPGADKAESWNIKVSDARGDLMRVLSGSGAVPPRLPWDGRDSDGRVVPDGDYESG